MSFLSGLKVFGTDIVKAFAWFGSPKGQRIVATGEGLLESVVPNAMPIVNLFNTWAAKAYSVEALAVAAGKATGSGPDKATAVLSAVAPDVLQYAQEAGVSARTDAQLQKANNALIDFINAMTSPA